jgi:hypothetical protein
MEHYTVNFRFDVEANGQEDANTKVEDTIKRFASYMGWEQPDRLVRVEEGQSSNG